MAEDIKSHQKVAVKFERKDDPRPQLPIEFIHYTELSPHDTIPRVFAFNELPGTKYHFLVMQLLGRSLRNRLQECNGTFSVKTTLQVAIKLLNCIEHLHSKGKMIHRDIKPDNFMFGHPNEHKQKRLFTIDLGLSKLWFADGEHVKREPRQFILGTKPYMSISAHEGFTQSRRDDLEAIGYMLFHFLNGELPWDGLRKKRADGSIDELGTHKLLADKKSTIPISELIGDNPAAFGVYLRQVRNLKFDETPDYKALKGLFVDLGKKLGVRFKDGGHFDWEEKRGASNDSEADTRSQGSSQGSKGKKKK
jgi:serine/threonine protein kinase